MKAKIIKQMPSTAVIEEGDHQEPFGTLQHVAHFPHVGVICQLKLGAAGLQYHRPGVTPHVIPREILIAFFESLEPKFAEKPNAETRPQEVDELGAAATAPEEQGRKGLKGRKGASSAQADENAI